MTQEQFKKIEDLKRKIENYEKILEFVKEGRGKFAYAIRSTLTFDYLTYGLDDEAVNMRIVELVKERLEEMKKEFNDITVM